MLEDNKFLVLDEMLGFLLLACFGALLNEL